MELFARGIENNQRPQNFQRYPASIFFHLISAQHISFGLEKWSDTSIDKNGDMCDVNHFSGITLLSTLGSE